MNQVPFLEFFGVAIKTLASKNSDKHHCWLTEKPKELHARMKQLSDKYSATLIPLQQLHFIEAGAFPYSHELSRTLDLMQQANMIKRENPSYIKFAPTWFDDSEEVISSQRKSLFGEDKNADAKFAEFVGELGTLQEKQ